MIDELKFVLRQLRKSPAFTFLAVIKQRRAFFKALDEKLSARPGVE